MIHRSVKCRESHLTVPPLLASVIIPDPLRLLATLLDLGVMVVGSAVAVFVVAVFVVAAVKGEKTVFWNTLLILIDVERALLLAVPPTPHSQTRRSPIPSRIPFHNYGHSSDLKRYCMTLRPMVFFDDFAGRYLLIDRRLCRLTRQEKRGYCRDQRSLSSDVRWKALVSVRNVY